MLTWVANLSVGVGDDPKKKF